METMARHALASVRGASAPSRQVAGAIAIFITLDRTGTVSGKDARDIYFSWASGFGYLVT
jgi:hypothetical protein